MIATTKGSACLASLAFTLIVITFVRLNLTVPSAIVMSAMQAIHQNVFRVRKVMLPQVQVVSLLYAPTVNIFSTEAPAPAQLERILMA
jgi:hypothetical protein